MITQVLSPGSTSVLAMITQILSPSITSVFERITQIFIPRSTFVFKMINQKFVMGPFEESDLPFEESRFSGVMAKIKPDNSVRMILNLSKGKPFSINDGIDKADYPMLGSSTKEFVRILFRCGRGAKITKNDWASVNSSEYFL